VLHDRLVLQPVCGYLTRRLLGVRLQMIERHEAAPAGLLQRVRHHQRRGAAARLQDPFRLAATDQVDQRAQQLRRGGPAGEGRERDVRRERVVQPVHRLDVTQVVLVFGLTRAAQVQQQSRQRDQQQRERDERSDSVVQKEPRSRRQRREGHADGDEKLRVFVLEQQAGRFGSAHAGAEGWRRGRIARRKASARSGMRPWSSIW
jgi:hypothetical protein